MLYHVKAHIIHLEIIYRKRRSIELSLRDSTDLRIVAPKGVSEKEIFQLLIKKEAWLANGISKMKEIESQKCSFREGEALPYLGKELKIFLESVPLSAPEAVFIREDYLWVQTHDVDQRAVQELIKAWYLTQAEQYIPQRVKKFQKLFSIEPEGVKIRGQKRRWGSCTGKNLLLFNWRLMMTPPGVLDYVVVHELCHMKEKNHQSEFWRQVAAIMPDYKIKVNWLLINGAQCFQNFTE